MDNYTILNLGQGEITKKKMMKNISESIRVKAAG